jgi:hypothetical protein
MKMALILAAIAEFITGLALLLVPSLVGWLLIGQEFVGLGAVAGRVAGLALIALSVACWPGLPLAAMLFYGAAVGVYLAYLGFIGAATGALLWPAVGLHLILTALLARQWIANSSARPR